MTLPVILEEEAQTEFVRAFDHYESQRPGLGLDFVERVQEVFDRISANPNMHQLVFKHVRKAVVRDFP